MALGVVCASGVHAQSRPVAALQNRGEAAVIETNGRGSVSVPFDQFTLRVEARGSAVTRGAALGNASARSDALRETLFRIGAISKFSISSSTPNIEAVGPGCNGYGGTCTPTSHTATISVVILAEPVTAAAAALVVLEEQGFVVGAPEYGLSTRAQADLTSRRMAFENAKQNADIAAQTAGCQRGKLLNITITSNPWDGGAEVVIVTGTRRDGNNNLAPSFNLQLEAGKATIASEVRTKFQLICN